MDFLTNRRMIGSKALFDFSHINKSTQRHLQRVYSCLAMGLLAAAVGCYVNFFFAVPMVGGFAGALVMIGLTLWLESGHGQMTTQRHVLFLAICFLFGASLKPLVGLAVDIDPSILVQAFMITILVTIGFSLAVLLSKQSRQLLMLAGPLSAGCLVLLGLSLVSMFYPSVFVFNMIIKLTLVIYCLFLLYDTQKVVELANAGDHDYISHSLDLFLDVIQLFRVILVILIQSQGEGKKRRKKNSE